MMTATYSPEDNKLRLYATSRLPRDLYDRVKAAGFKWAPKQELFVAPAWTPDREDLLLELCGEIGDEDTSLVDRAEERSERFEEYSEKREAEADRAKAAVDAIADAIPFGQPILVGHHSEKHARRDAEKIRNGMTKAVNLWKTSQYWASRAEGAIRHAKYKERPDVRARRIQTLEADQRKYTREMKEAQTFRTMWQKDGLTLDRAKAIANADHISKSFDLATYPRDLPASQYEGPMSLWSALEDGIIPPHVACSIAVNTHNGMIEWAARWLAHIDNRLTYERAMLAEAGGTVADRTGPEKGGACRCWASPGYGKGWSYIQKVNKVSVTVLDNWGNGGANFTRTIPFDKLAAVMTKAEVDAAKAEGRIHEAANGIGFFLDSPAETRAESNQRAHEEAVAARQEKDEKAKEFAALAETARAGVQVVTAPQLFPTPPHIAARMVELAEIEGGHKVLEPSAGTGNLLAAIKARPHKGPNGCTVTAVEINQALARSLEPFANTIQCADFLEWAPEPMHDESQNGELFAEPDSLYAKPAGFDRIVMNPPFAQGSDIKHIRHALTMLNEGGRLVAICANGPRQQEQLQPLADHWEELPEGTFAGTGVRAALLVVTK